MYISMARICIYDDICMPFLITHSSCHVHARECMIVAWLRGGLKKGGRDSAMHRKTPGSIATTHLTPDDGADQREDGSDVSSFRLFFICECREKWLFKHKVRNGGGR